MNSNAVKYIINRRKQHNIEKKEAAAKYLIEKDDSNGFELTHLTLHCVQS